MSISLHTGYPGSGKSHALVKDVIVPAVLNGRRVVTNVDGINPDAIRGYCAERVDDAGQLGEVVTFDGQQASDPGFWPTESVSDADTFIKGGDLIVFDEWRLYFKARGNGWAPDDLVKFLRWHRHLTHEGGHSTDVHIATQLSTDLHSDVRGLCERSYKYAKLRAAGMENQYSWKVWQGHLQAKNQHYANGLGTYDKAIFPLYKSSQAAAGSHSELSTNKRDSIWSQPKTWIVLVLPFILLGLGLWKATAFFSQPARAKGAPLTSEAVVGGPAVPGAVPAPAAPAAAFWRIVGTVEADSGVLVVVQDGAGNMRTVEATGFDFVNGRAVAGLVDGVKATARDDVPIVSQTQGILG